MKNLSAYPELTSGLGLATNTYKQVLASGEITMEELIRWAADRGFSWVEVRDPNVLMEEQNILQLLHVAKEKNIRLHYAWDNEDVLSPNPQFVKGMDNAALFGEGTCCRVLIAPNTVSGKAGYSASELECILPVMKDYIRQAKERKIVLCFENSMEPLKGDGESYFGMSELLEFLPEMCTTFDAANFMTDTTVVNPSEQELLDYYNKYTDQMFYFHMKMTHQHRLIDDLSLEGDFNMERLLETFAKNNRNMLVCLEIPQQKTLAAMNQAIERSIVFLNQFSN